MTDDTNNNFFDSDYFKDILKEYEECMKNGRDCILASNDIALIADYYFEQKNVAKAKEVGEYALSLYPDATDSLTFMAKYKMHTERDFKAARQLLERVDDYGNYEYIICIAELEMMERHSADVVMKIITDGLDATPDEEKGYLKINLCNLLIDYNYITEAKSIANDIENDNPEEFTIIKARLLTTEGKGKEAIAILNELIDKDTFNVYYWNTLMNVQMECKDFSGAISSAEYTVAIDPECFEAYMAMGAAYMSLGNYEKAIASLKEYIRICNDEAGYIMIAQCYYYMNEDEKALKMLLKTDKMFPYNTANRPEILKALAVIYDENGDHEKALELARKAMKEGCKEWYDMDCATTEIGALFSLGRSDEAIMLINKYGRMMKGEDLHDFLFKTAVVCYDKHFIIEAYALLNELYVRFRGRTTGMPFYAACCYQLKKDEEYIYALELAISIYPKETKDVLGWMFPRDMEVYDYLKYAKEHHVDSDKND